MISVIVPVYNTEKYLKKCVESIQSQTYKDLEIILVDDGSPDNAGQLCDEVANSDERIIVIHKKNGGLSDARNAGMDIARGEFITFVDSDDYLSEDMYTNMLSAITDAKADISMCGVVSEKEDTSIIKTDLFEQNNIYVGREIVNSFVLNLQTAVWNKLFRANLLKTIRFPVGRIHGEDLVFFMNLMNEKIKLVTTDYIGYHYVKHDGSITNTVLSDKSFDEVYCKDLAHSIMLDKFPGFSNNSIVWCFRSRLNLVRKMILSDTDIYANVTNDYLNWLSNNYNIIKNKLSKKTRLEYRILKSSKKIYKLIFRLI